MAQPFQVAPGIESATIAGLENGVAYTFSVATVDLSGNTSTATAGAPVTAIGVPPSETDITNLSRTSSADGTVIILWVDPTGADFSHVLVTWDPVGGDQTQPLRVEKGEQTATITGLFAGNDYTFTVVNVDTAGMEATPTATEPVTVMGTPPSLVAVTNVTGFARANGSAEITWSDPLGADFSHILITWDEAGETETQSVRIESGVETATITGLTDGTEYTFSVVAVNVAGRQADAVTAVLTADTSVNPVTGVSAATADNSGATLSWTDPSDSDLSHIQITWSPGGGNLAQPLEVASGTEEVTILHLTAGRVTTFTVQAVDVVGNTAAETTTVTATADATAPSDVTNLTATPLVNGSVELTWDDPTDFDFSHVLISWSGSADQTSPVDVNKEVGRTTLTGLTDGTSYTFTVSSFDSTGNQTTGESVGATANTSVPAVTSLSAEGGYTGAGVTWTDPSVRDLSHVNITWEPATIGQTQPLRVVPGIQAVVLSGLTNSTPYTITATSVDTLGHTATATTTVTPDASSVPVLISAASIINVDGDTTITWVDPPTGSGAAKISITGSPNPTDATEVDLGDQSVVFSGLTALGTDHTFTINTLDASDSVVGTVTVTANAVTSRPVALFSLGGRQGNFGFAACNTFLTDDTGEAATAMRNAGYTEAVFFGSRPGAGAYTFPHIATDTDALGLATTGGVTTAKLSGRLAVVYRGSVPITTFGGNPTASPPVSATTRTIDNVVNVTSGGAWRNGGYDVVRQITGGNFWTFTLNRSLRSTATCSGATSSSSGKNGGFGNRDAVDAGATNSGFFSSCNNGLAVICAAH